MTWYNIKSLGASKPNNYKQDNLNHVRLPMSNKGNNKITEHRAIF